MSIGNKNFKEDRRNALLRTIKEGHSEAQANRRLRGRTVAIALNTISIAMLYPGENVEIQDHADTEAAKENLVIAITTILDSLQLVGFSLNPKDLTYTLDYIYENR